MGYTRHHAIIVTGQCYGTVGWVTPAKAHAKALEIWGDDFERYVSHLSPATINACQSFVVYPDGSNEWWPESDLGNERRAKFVEWLESCRYEDGSSPIAWVEVQYGDDRYQTKVVNDSDAAMRAMGEAGKKG